jgi:ubiquinone/menaquinone biosynthesis C-methylase UbiE
MIILLEDKVMERKEHEPMHFSHAKHLLNPLRKIIQSPKGLVKKIGIRPNHNVLELGPGPGFFSVEFARAIPNGKLVLVDIQQEMLDMASERLRKNKITNVEFRIGNANELPIIDNSIDVAVLIGMFGEVPEPEKCLKEIGRILTADGILAITESKIGDPDYIKMPDLIELLKNNGFKNEKKFNEVFQYTIIFKKT